MKIKRFSMVCLAAAALVISACVSQQKYNALDQEYQQLQQSMGAEVGAQKMQISRLQNAIKVTVNGELLFPSGGWQMPAQAQQTIAKMAAILAPQQTTKIIVNGYTDNTPIGPGLMRQGVTSQPHPVAEAGRQCDAVHDLAGRQSKPCFGTGVRRCRSGRV